VICSRMDPLYIDMTNQLGAVGVDVCVTEWRSFEVREPLVRSSHLNYIVVEDRFLTPAVDTLSVSW
jgi:hypothetical protein